MSRSERRLIFLYRLATVRKHDPLARKQLGEFGVYVAECLPKYVQKALVSPQEELELLIAPGGIVPVLQFLKDHHHAQFTNIVDIAGVDMPSRQYRFEVCDFLNS